MQRERRDGPYPRLIPTRGRRSRRSKSNRSNLECFNKGGSGGSRGRDGRGRGPHARSIGRVVPTFGFVHFENGRGLEKMGRVCYREEIHKEEEWMK